MQAFEANKEGFPNGLKSTITKLRTMFPNLRHIAVWHALVCCSKFIHDDADQI